MSPFDGVANLPPKIKEILPKPAQEIFVQRFDYVYYKFNWTESHCYASAWEAVRRVYKKSDKTCKWIRR